MVVQKYDLQKELGSPEIDIDKFANKVIENINKDNKDLIMTLKEETYDKAMETIVNSREKNVKEFKEYKEAEKNKIVEKLLMKVAKNIEEAQEEKQKFEKTNEINL